MNSWGIFAVLAVLFVAVVLVLLLGVGKIVYGIAHYYIRERKPVRKFKHPELGLLTSDDTDDTLWSGHAKTANGELPFFLSGTQDGPDQRLVASLQEVLARVASIQHKGLDFLRTMEPTLDVTKLELYVLSFSHQRRPNDFTLEFADPANDAGVWRVEFHDGEPKDAGFDDRRPSAHPVPGGFANATSEP